MTLTQTLQRETDSDIVTQLAGNLNISTDNLRLFSECSGFLTDLLQHFNIEKTHLYVVGHASTDIAIIADRADLPMTESLGSSPFSVDTDEITEEAVSPHDIIYLSNPNRVTGATLSRAGIEMLTNAVPDGLLIVDEQYFDFYGISAIGLLGEYQNIVVLRSFAATYGILSAESGYVVSTESILSRVCSNGQTQRLSTSARKMITTILADQSARSNRLAMVHGESLRISSALTRLGIQNRISATDFILLRVEDPTAVGNFLTRYRVSIDNLDGYPGLDHYLRFRIQSPASNDEFIRSFSRMPSSIYRMKSLDNRLTTMRKGEEQKPPSPPSIEQNRVKKMTETSANRKREITEA